VTPDDVLEALKTHDFDRVHSVADSSFRNEIATDEIRRVCTEMEDSLGRIESVGPIVVLHDLGLRCEKGNAHLQVAYRDGTISGLVLLDGSPTGRFGH
jgi:hypothetical protein